MVIVIISAASKYEGYGTEKVCWLSTEHGLIWAFLAPVAFIIFVSRLLPSTLLFFFIYCHCSFTRNLLSGEVFLRCISC
ncbi:Adhesion G protein-coupled receptor L1 [Holothuria leucospilota]|uniref:Adhesion G protein-coupled receptor L1 n=1 Tax=Holothuria leucospilota TaxID=206669 RepID=A0A9Q1CKM8_HOLLE|nr:Adhesion G protein-coupled receptor L1 [Holothuria leucospilota]